MSSLRVKVEFVLFLVLGLVVALGYGIQRFVILPGLAPLEQQVAKTEMMLCRKAIVEEVTDLEDDCAACVVAPPDIVSSDLLKQHKFDFLYVLDHEGRVLTGKAVDRETLKEVDIEEFPSTEWPMVHPLLSFSGDVSGVYMTSQGPAIVTSRIVPTGDVTDRAPHRLVAGRMLDRNFLREIYHSSRVAFAVWQKDDPNLPEDLSLIHI